MGWFYFSSHGKSVSFVDKPVVYLKLLSLTIASMCMTCRGFLVRWTLRIAAWLLLGPWMKLVDIFYVKRIQSTEEQEKEAKARVKAKYKALLANALHTQTRKEELTKLKAMKRYMFGEYLAVLPRFKEERWLDIPLAASYAYPHVAVESYDIVNRKYGQHLTGDMIPMRLVVQLRFCHTGIMEVKSICSRSNTLCPFLP